MDNENNRSNSFASKAKDYYQLIKFTLSFTVVFSCVVCYLLAPNVKEFDWLMIAILFVAGMLVTGSANAINQAVEKDTDAIMKRTGSRPVAAGRMTQQEAYTFAVIAGLVGVGMMWYFFNLSSALLSAFSLFLYAFIYTPLKKINSIAGQHFHIPIYSFRFANIEGTYCVSLPIRAYHKNRHIVFCTTFHCLDIRQQANGNKNRVIRL